MTPQIYKIKESINIMEKNITNLKFVIDHITVKFDKKNYYCVEHFKPFVKYCFDHKKNLCEECVFSHENDKVKSLKEMTPQIDKIKESISIMEKNITNLKTVIDDIKNSLDGALRIFKRYVYVANDIIGKFELFNKELKNYNILKSLRNLTLSNDKMNKDLEDIIKESDLSKKASNLIKIHLEKEENYKNIDLIKKQDISKDNDDDWFESIGNEEKLKNSGQKQEKQGST